ncbi:MAG: YdeI/OmpD-associated family protein [Acidobacteriota bacterium]|nr:MAG: YdeI/OmpD-associated family protein [Acidobacteriota bacterium]
MKLPRSSVAAGDLPFAEPAGYGLGKSGWVTSRFAPRDRVPLDLLDEWIEESFRAVAPKRLVAALDRGPSDERSLPVARSKTAKRKAAKTTATQRSAGPETSPKVDAYIAKSGAFARPILKKVRAAFHEGCPELREVMKWSTPHFEHHGLLGGMAAFKEHVSFGFWRGKELDDRHGNFQIVGRSGMSSMKVASVRDLPAKRELVRLVRQAKRLNEAGPAKRPVDKRGARALPIPDWFMAALRKNRKALATFEAFSTSHRNEYVEWVTAAKQDATRENRMKTAIEWMEQGKPRNWRYMKKR